MLAFTAKSTDTSILTLSPDIKHLLSRTLLLSPDEKHSVFIGKSRKQIVDILLKYDPVANSLPLKDYDAVQAEQPDVRVAFGKTWIYDVNHDSNINEKRKNSLINWIVGSLCKDDPDSLMPRMFLFWADFFDMQLSKIPFAPKAFRHFDLIRNHALGNYADLLTEIIADPGMIYYYRKLVPGEKRIFEFATQQLAGKLSGHIDDTSRLSREKLRKLARIINKWHFICDNADLHYPNLKPLDIYKEENKQYYDAYFNRSGAREVLEELRNLINSVLDFQTALSLTERLFENFLTKEKKPEYVQKLIIPAAEAFYHSKFEICDWLREFFTNDVFAKPELRHGLIKMPIEFLIKLSYQLRIIKPSMVEIENYNYWEWLSYNASRLGQNLFGSQKASEVNSETIIDQRNGLISSKMQQARFMTIERLLETGYIMNDRIEFINLFDLIKEFRNPADPMELIDEAVEKFFDKPIRTSQKRLLVETCLLDGKKDYYSWTHLWNEATINDKKEAKILLSEKLKSLLKFLLIQPEYNFY